MIKTFKVVDNFHSFLAELQIRYLMCQQMQLGIREAAIEDGHMPVSIYNLLTVLTLLPRVRACAKSTII